MVFLSFICIFPFRINERILSVVLYDMIRHIKGKTYEEDECLRQQVKSSVFENNVGRVSDRAT